MQWTSDWKAPILEEMMKAAILFAFILRRRIAFIVETVIYGAAIGAGFALLENIIYISYNPDMLIGNAIIRGFGTALLHIGGTSLAGSMCLMMTRIFINGDYRHYVIWLLVPLLALSLLPSVGIHYFYNLFLLPPYLQIVLVIGLYLLFFYATYVLDEKQINNWLDCCINNDVKLLSEIQTGHLSDTNAGQYLMMVKKQFEPEVFFDLIMYLQLYLELSIAAKSRMMMNEAGLDPSELGEDEDELRSKLEELHILEKNIGMTGMNVLRPIVVQKSTDKWALDRL